MKVKWKDGQITEFKKGTDKPKESGIYVTLFVHLDGSLRFSSTPFSAKYGMWNVSDDDSEEEIKRYRITYTDGLLWTEFPEVLDECTE